MCRRLFENGVFVNPVVNPAVPPGRELLRTSFMATHTEEQLDKVLNAFEKVGKELGVIYHGIRWNDR
jgi:7-keto-8-aminopelargonate synthetase-like enzyme